MMWRVFTSARIITPILWLSCIRRSKFPACVTSCQSQLTLKAALIVIPFPSSCWVMTHALGPDGWVFILGPEGRSKNIRYSLWLKVDTIERHAYDVVSVGSQISQVLERKVDSAFLDRYCWNTNEGNKRMMSTNYLFYLYTYLEQ